VSELDDVRAELARLRETLTMLIATYRAAPTGRIALQTVVDDLTAALEGKAEG
jgi:hypothetical protein